MKEKRSEHLAETQRSHGERSKNINLPSLSQIKPMNQVRGWPCGDILVMFVEASKDIR